MGTAAAPVARLKGALTHGSSPTFSGLAFGVVRSGPIQMTIELPRPPNGTGAHQVGQLGLARARCAPRDSVFLPYSQTERRCLLLRSSRTSRRFATRRSQGSTLLAPGSATRPRSPPGQLPTRLSRRHAVSGQGFRQNGLQLGYGVASVTARLIFHLNRIRTFRTSPSCRAAPGGGDPGLRRSHTGCG